MTSYWDDTWGVGQQMSALEVIQANLAQTVQGPYTNKTGGTSQGDDNAGSKSDDAKVGMKAITGGDRAGASILTILVLVGWLGGLAWLAI